MHFFQGAVEDQLCTVAVNLDGLRDDPEGLWWSGGPQGPWVTLYRVDTTVPTLLLSPTSCPFDGSVPPECDRSVDDYGANNITSIRAVSDTGDFTYLVASFQYRGECCPVRDTEIVAMQTQAAQILAADLTAYIRFMLLSCHNDSASSDLVTASRETEFSSC